MPPRPARDAEALRLRLLSHSRALIAREGVPSFTMRALAAEAGVAVGLPYKAFASRDELLRELTWESVVDLARQLEEWAARPGGQLADRLMEFSDLLHASVAPALVARLSHEPDASEILTRAVDAGFTRSWADLVTQFLRERQEQGEVSDEVDVEGFGYLLTAAMHHTLVTNGPFAAPDRRTFAGYIERVAARLRPLHREDPPIGR